MPKKRKIPSLERVLNNVGNPTMFPDTSYNPDEAVYNPASNVITYNPHSGFARESIPHELGHAYQNNVSNSLSTYGAPPARRSVVRTDIDYYNRRQNELDDDIDEMRQGLGSMSPFISDDVLSNKVENNMYLNPSRAEGEAEQVLAPQILEDLNRYAGGGRVSDPTYDTISNYLMQKNRSKNFVQRALNPDDYPITHIDGTPIGSVSTELMAYDNTPNNYRAYPTIIQSGPRSLQHLGDDEAYDYANKTGEYINLPNSDKFAEYFTNTGYKKPGGILQKDWQKYAAGGESLTPINDITDLYPELMKSFIPQELEAPIFKRKPYISKAAKDKSLPDVLDDSTPIKLSEELMKKVEQEKLPEEAPVEEDTPTPKPKKKVIQEETPIISTPNRLDRYLTNDNNSNIIASKESGGNYQAVSPNSPAIGKYQFIWPIHSKEIQKVTGVKTEEEFLNNPTAQEKYYKYWDDNTLTPGVTKYGKALRGTLGNISDSQIKQAIHFAGEGNVKKAIKSGNFDIPLDANGTSIRSYITPKKYAMGGTIHIKPSHKGKFTAYKKRTGKTTEEALHSKDPHVRKMANFAKNAKKWKHGMGGYLNDINMKKRILDSYTGGGMVPAEVEGGEGVQTPDGSYGTASGPSHEQGGIPVGLPDGTKIYSDRLSINGQTMKDRKDAREKAMARIQKAVDKNPNNIRKTTLQRIMEVTKSQEEKDMALQQLANAMYPTMGNSNKKGMGGVSETDMGTGVETGDTSSSGFGASMPWGQIIGGALQIGTQLAEGNQPKQKNPLIAEYRGMRPYATGGYADGSLADDNPIYTDSSNPNDFLASDYITPGQQPAMGVGMNNSMIPTNISPLMPRQTNSKMGYTTGDMVGMAGNAFGSIAPLLNTLANRAGDKPNINAYKGFGRDAIDANTNAGNQIAGIRNNQMEDLRIQRNTARMNNRNSASSVNTIRALDYATDAGYSKGSNDIANNYANQIMANLERRGSLTNTRDQFVMSGEMQRDKSDRMDRDNFNTNIGQDLGNLSTGIQAQGKYMNQSQHRQDFLSLLPELSKHGLGIEYDEQGNPILKKLR